MADDKKIKGRIDIDTDEAGLLAVLHFIPDENGTEYEAAGIYRLISEKNIVFGINRKALDAKLGSLFSSPQEVTITVAEGDSPESPIADKREWVQHAIPEDIREDVEKFLRNAPPPEIYHLSVEKLKQETVVKKKGLLPFGKEKEEKVVETVNRQIKKRIDVAPDVLEAGWVAPDEKLAEIIRGVPGKPGRSVFGKPLPPDAEDTDFWIGHGVERKGNFLIAAARGILRRGWNWVEVFPFKSHDWSLELSKDKNTCLLNFNPGGVELSTPDPAEIIERAEMLGCSAETLVGAARISEIIENAVASGRELKQAVISSDEDGHFEIKVSDEKLKAELTMHKARGNGKPLVLKEVGAAIKASGLSGLDLKKIQDTILEFYKGIETDISFTLTEGTDAEHEEAGDLEFELEFIKRDRADEIRKRADSLGEEYLSKIESAEEFHPSAADNLAMVRENQQIASLPVSVGKRGKDVFGREIESNVADLSHFRALENVKVEKQVIVSCIKGLAEIFVRDGITAIRVREHGDASFTAKLSADRMEAVLSAEPAVGSGLPASLEEANRVLAEAGVKSGIDAEALRSVVDSCRRGESVRSEVVAKGKQPVSSGDERLKFLIELAGGRAVTIGADGRADYRKQNRFSSVVKDDKLARIFIVKGESEDGWDVTGSSLAAKQGASVTLDVGANIRSETDDEGNRTLIAEKSGRLIYENNRIEVQENLYVKGDVDFSSGNIKFSGDVNVKGNVRSGFFVMAGGDISIGMNSEMSLLSSEKSIMVAQGIKGGGKAILRAKNSIQLSFAERATLLAVEDITVKNAVFGCKVKCNGKLRLISEKGYLVGGRIQARKGIEAANIGSISGSRTEVSFGQDYLISDRIETEEKEIEKIKTRLIKIDSEMRLAEKSADHARLTNLRLEKVKLLKIMEKRSMRVFTLKERFEQHFPGEVIIRGEVFPGVVFESHGRTLEISKNEKALKIVFNQDTGVLEKVPLAGKDVESGGKE